MLFNLLKLVSSFKYALKGLVYAFGQQNFRIHVLASIFVVALMIYFPLSTLERIGLIMLIIIVLVLEILNTIFEKIADVLIPRINPVIEVIKDLMAAAVLISATASAVIGFLIFYPYFMNWFQ